MRWIGRILRRHERASESVVTRSDSSAETTVLQTDNPIKKSSDDVLGRVGQAETFCQSVLRVDPSEGLVVGVLGPWGSGKTSFVNMAREWFEHQLIPVVDFNPWMFSGAEQLVSAFFDEVSAQLKLKPGLLEAGQTIEQYGELFANLAWLPVVGEWIERSQKAAQAVANLIQRKKGGIAGQRAKVNEALKKVDKPIVVILDDIDRLSDQEIRDVFRLVRLTANFPNLIYVLVFDRKRVESALADQGFPGRAYLEKILQVSFDLPIVPDSELNQQIFKALDVAIQGVGIDVSLDQELWPDVFFEIVRPLISNLRDVKRYAAAASVTIRDLGGKIELSDVLALEAIRLFLPDVFSLIPSAVDSLTGVANHGYQSGREDSGPKQDIENIIRAAGDKAPVARAMITRTFMAAQRHIGNMNYGQQWVRRWLRERRVANADVLRLYLERVAGEGWIAFDNARRAWAVMGDAVALDAYLRSLPSTKVVDAISSLEAYEDEVTPDRVVPGIVAILNVLPDLPEVERGMFSFDSDMLVSRVVYRLIRSLQSEAKIEAAVAEALPRIRTLHGRLTLIEMVGHSEGVGHKLVSQEEVSKFLRSWREQLRTLPPDALARESKLARLIFIARRDVDRDEPLFEVPADPHVTLSLLRSVRGESRSQHMGSRAVKRSPRLGWKLLIEVVGGEDVLRQRIEDLQVARLDDVENVVELAVRYLSGWRPEDDDRA